MNSASVGTKITSLPALLNAQHSSFQCSNAFISIAGSLIYLKSDVLCYFFVVASRLLHLICDLLDATFTPTITPELSSPPRKPIEGPAASLYDQIKSPPSTFEPSGLVIQRSDSHHMVELVVSLQSLGALSMVPIGETLSPGGRSP
jgi:hypothetical protein